MTQQVDTVLDAVTGSNADETVRFGVDGRLEHDPAASTAEPIAPVVDLLGGKPGSLDPFAVSAGARTITFDSWSHTEECAAGAPTAAVVGNLGAGMSAGIYTPGEGRR